MSTLDDLGSEVAETLGVGPDVDRALSQRQRLISAPRSAGARGWRAPLVVGGSVAAALALSLIWIDVPSLTPGLHEESPASEGSGLHAGMYLQAPDSDALRVELREGGHLRLAPRARARVIEASDTEVHLALEEGGLEATFSSATGLAYLIEAGPLRIASRGATFDVHWHATQREIDIDVAAGDVEVSGGSFGDSGLRVAGGTHVKVGSDGALVYLDKPATDPADPAGVALNESPAGDATAGVDGFTKRARRTGSKQARKDTTRTEPARWRDLAERGEYAAALRAAEEEGFAELVARLGAADLRRLADAARVARDSDRAREALLALRRRFPASRDGKLAAFLLGRVATELDGDHSDAARWFETYARENPTGSLRQIAEGRIIDELHKAGDRVRAKAAAQRYLERYEAGPYHDLARLLAE